MHHPHGKDPLNMNLAYPIDASVIYSVHALWQSCPMRAAFPMKQTSMLDALQPRCRQPDLHGSGSKCAAT